jgi:hypothetical protein
VIGQASVRYFFSASGLRDIALGGLFVAFSLLAGILVVTVLLVVTSPIIQLFPRDSGAQDIVLGVSLLWGAVSGCVVAAFTTDPYRRMRIRMRGGSPDEAESVPLEMIGRPIARRVANERRMHTPARIAAGYSLAATTSTSTRASGRASAEITKRVEAGASLPRNWARTSR